MPQNNYSVCQFLEDGNYEFVRRFISAEEAVNVAIHYSTSIAAKNHIVTRVIITDSGDQCNWEWKFDEGITFPPQFVGKLKRGIR